MVKNSENKLISINHKVGCACCNGHNNSVSNEISRRKFMQVTGTTVLGTLALTGLSSSALASIQAADIPSIDEMASQWLAVDEIVHMPSLHNFHEMAACSEELLGVNYNPGGQLYAGSGKRWYQYNTLPLVKLIINGQAHNSTHCRWYPYQAVRKKTIDDLEVTTTVRMAFEELGILYQVLVRNVSDKSCLLNLAFDVPGKLHKSSESDIILYQSSRKQLVMAHAPTVKPNQCTQKSDDRATMEWVETIKPGESRTFSMVMTHDGVPQAGASVSPVIQTSREWAADFEAIWGQAKARWARRWTEVFTPNNSHFSGHLPTLVTDDEKIREIYYRSILTLICLHRTNLKMCNRAFITSGERSKGVVYFWDTSMWSTVFALLEPEGMKQQLRLFLQCDPHSGPVYFMNDGYQPGGGWYGANDMTIFRLAYTYLAVTDDIEFLDEQVGDRSVLKHLETLATNWQKLQRDKTIMLADYGENENLLECAPAYIHRVPSFNAANVWMMREVAELYELRGNKAEAIRLRDLAGQFAQEVLKLYKKGDGVWYALHRDGSQVELRHCYDFTCIGRFMTDDLTSEMKQEMVAFVEAELLTEKWMRAMSLKDLAAARSDRPDHGPMGAFDAWPALTVASMCRVGAWDSGVDFLRRTQAVLKEGVYAQAREFYGPDKTTYNAPVRIAMRRGCMRECTGGGAFAETVIDTLFGFVPKVGSAVLLDSPKTVRGDFRGKLVNVHRRGSLFSITSSAAGISMVTSDHSNKLD
jgi:hypothetical protein